MEDSALVKKAKKGDKDAFGQLYDKYIDAIFRFVLFKVSRKEDAEDITHQAFLKAWQNVPKYKDKGHPFSSWLYRIARNLVIDFYRTAKRDLELDEAPDEALSERSDMGAVLDTTALATLTRVSLKDLDDIQESVLVMKFVNEMTNREIAEAIGKSEGAVRVIQHRALKKLKTNLQARQGNLEIYGSNTQTIKDA